MDELIITAAQLRATTAATVIFDCRFSLMDHSMGQREFHSGHIPGAFHLDMEKDLAGEKTGTNGRHPLPLRLDLQKVLRAAGVDETTNVVIYDANRFAGAARAWWLMRFFGLTRVQLLDGGFAAWRDAGFDVESGSARPRAPGNITLAAGSRTMVARRNEILSDVRQGSGSLVDAREPARYAGLEEPIDPVAGRIPGARNLPWIDITDQAGRVAKADALRTLWEKTDTGEDPIVYCGSGVTASVVLLARTLAGLPGGRLYPGSWSEWCAHEQSPVERSTDPDA
jgi:thiosulfate/3-mercaptopyruvate sulfurtransferase